MKIAYRVFEPDGGFALSYISTLLNRFQLWKAKRLADQLCFADRKRRYVLPMMSMFVVASSSEIYQTLKGVNRNAKCDVMKLIESSLYIADFNNLNKRKNGKEN